MQKIIAIHQPNYLPWLGYFYKISCCDLFIFHDNVELTKKGYTRRTNIRKGNTAEKIYLTVPLKKHSDFALIKDLEIANHENWQQKQLNKLNATYSKTPYYNQFKIVVEELLSQNIYSLSELNIACIRKISELLEFKTEFCRSSELPVAGKGNEYNLNLCKHFQATHYASGKGAKNYQDESAFQNEGIEIIYSDFFSYLSGNPYPQQQDEFLNGLSILDALFNIGANEVRTMFQNYSAT